MFKIYDGREKFYQWDLDRRLVLEDPTVTEVHFCNRTDNCSLVCETFIEDGLTLVNVPNVLLTTDWKIHVYAYDGKHTKHDECYEVISRTKPADYVYTETEVLNYKSLEERIESLEKETDAETVGAKTEENGEIFNDYKNNKALSPQSTAKGKNNLAGTKGFTIVAWDASNKTYTLDSVEGLTVGDRISIEWVESYSDCNAITAIDLTTNTITVDEFIIGSSTDESVEKELFIHNKPWLGTHSYGYGAYAEGADNIALLTCAHTEGRGNKSLGFYSHTEGRNNVANYTSHAEGRDNFAIGDMSHAEGRYTKALGHHSHAEGNGDKQDYVIAEGSASHAEGKSTKAIGNYSHAEGFFTKAEGENSHAEGYHTTTEGKNSHAEGYHTTTFGENSHAEGRGAIASGEASHAEGANTKASNYASHAEGYGAIATGKGAHAEGNNAIASGDASHAEGGNTVATEYAQHVQGTFNYLDENGKAGNYAHIVGGGSSYGDRKNIHTLDWRGNAWFSGTVEANAFILIAPNGNKFKLTVSNGGVLSTTAVI